TVIATLKRKSLSLKEFFHSDMMRRHFFILAFLSSYLVLGQSDFSFEGVSEAGVFVSSSDSLPLWFSTNNAARLGRASDLFGLAGAVATYKISENSKIQGGASFYYRNNLPEEFQRNQLFISFENSFVEVTLGAKKIEEKAQGLSATNMNMLWSGNSRPIPGLRIASQNPLMVTRQFGVDFGIAHYELNDDRYVDDVRLHYKHLALVYNLNERNTITAKLQHFAQWGGTSPEFGALKKDFSGFIDVFTAREAFEIGVDGEIYNAVGNHLGSYFLDYTFQNSAGRFSIYHEHVFDDGSGTALKNFPDGVWGAYFEPKSGEWLDALLYEYITTRNQSSKTRPDNYFNNSVYRTGWTYEGNIIGLPFMLTTPRNTLSEAGITFISNALSMHHFGISGTLKMFDWKIRSSFVQNFGGIAFPFSKTLTTTHHYFEIAYPTKNFGRFKLQTGFDTSSATNSIFGGGLHYEYSF
ncbi:MAG: capsule assembly Wzi family protein, partial [Marinirhabdus sp.]|nr:capsule assembly Wzi family protein [Marinirhabdus sp.]